MTARAPKPEPPLLMTKLGSPPAREQIVSRKRLVQRLRPGPGIKLTVVAAPAGSGKTTLLGLWRDAEAARRPVAWVTLDEGDDDAVVLWSHVVEAFCQVCPGVTAQPSLRRVGAARIAKVVLPKLINDLAEEGDVALVLDDFDRLSSGGGRDSLAWFIEHAPSTLHLVIASRNEPALPLGALRAHGQLRELRAAELGFTSDEAEALLNGKLDLGLTPQEIHSLVERTEGWAAGLYLAALSLRGVEDHEAFVSRFGGNHRHVVDFLVDEVLEAHGAAAQTLMLRSSICEPLCGSLCDAILERSGSARVLSKLSRTNLFLVPVDDDGDWYRFHQLFAQLLRVELEHREPGLAPTLHRRAYEWHRDHGSASEAIEHAVEAGALEEAAELINAVWLQTVNAGRPATVLGWLKRLPPELLLGDPRLLLIRVWTQSLSGHREDAEAGIAALERLGWPDQEPLPDGSSSLEASVATIRAGFPAGDVDEGERNARRAMELETPESPLWPAVCWSLGMNRYYRGELVGADGMFETAVRAGTRKGRWLIAVSSLAFRSLIAGERQQRDRQHLLAQQAITLAQARGVDDLNSEVHTARGESIAASGQFDEALPHLARGVSIARSLRRPLELVNALVRLAALSKATNRSDAAVAALAEAKAALDSCRDPGLLRERLEALERPRQVRKREAKLSERELVVLRMLEGPLSERDIGRELYLSHNTVHSHTKAIYRKLGVSSRKQALQRALALGIL